MEVMIAYPLVLPDEPLSLDAIEAAVQAWALRLAQAALAEAWRVQEALRPVACPTCHSTQARRAGEKPRRIETRCGPVWLRRIRMRCTGCGRHFQPDDLPLAAALGGGHCTTALRALAAHCGASWPYRQAAQVLGMVRGTPLAPETVRRIVAQAGTAVAKQYEAEAVTACQPPATAPPPMCGPAALAVVLDGAWIHSHDNAHGMEIKVGVVHTGSVACGATRTRLVQRRYAATAQGVTLFGPLVTAGIDHVGGFAATEQTLLGDGAAWIWRLGGELLPAAIQVLDRCGCPLGRCAMHAAAPPGPQCQTKRCANHGALALRMPWTAAMCRPRSTSSRRCSNGIRTRHWESSPAI